MKKLKFQKLLTIVAVAIFVMNVSVAFGQSSKAFGIQLYSAKSIINRDVPGTIEKIGAMGYKYVELYSFLRMKPTDLKALCEKNGLKILSSHVRPFVADSTGAEWDKLMSWWDKCIEEHLQLGVKYIVQAQMDQSVYTNIDRLKLYCKYFNAVGEKCRKKGIRFAYHNHSEEFQKIGDITIYDYILQHTDPKNLTMELDLWWIYKSGASIVDYLNKYPGRFELFHLKGEKELGLDNDIDYKSIYALAKKAGLKHSIIEIEEYNLPVLEGLKTSLDFALKADYIRK